MSSEKTQNHKLNTYFYSGKYKLVVSHLEGQTTALNENQTFLKIGSLVFLGDIDEAQFLYESSKQFTKSSSFQFRCRFYLGIGNVRRSQYSKAITYFAKNLYELRRTQATPEITFYAYQGAAFFRFFKGQYEKTKALAFLAYTAAYKDDFLYGQVLAQDLLGHASCQLGSIRQGLHELEKALELSLKIGNGGIETALKISLVKYRAQFGIDIKKTIPDLLQAIQQLNPQDTYSRAELFLELSRQYLLRGQGIEAQNILESASELIYKHQNKRQSATYNLRYSHLLFLRGESHTARALIQSQKMSLDRKMDLSILQQLAGLEQKIQGQYKRKGPRNHAEDPLGDAIDSAEQDGFLAYTKIKELKLFGLFPRIFKIPAGQSVIILGPQRSELIAMNGADVDLIDSGVTAPMKILLQQLQGAGFKSKKQLIEKTWSYNYQGDVHDRLLHATIAKIRSRLGPFSHWIEWSSAGYRLNPAVQVLIPNAKAKKEMPLNIEWNTGPAALSNSEIKTSDLNDRQLKTLNIIRKGEFVGVTEYAKVYKISKMTACRDLTHLLKLGLVIKVGRARATKYGDLRSK